MEIKIEPNVMSKYAQLYSDEATDWRELGGKYKAENIIAVCADGYQFNKVLEVGAGEGSILKHLDATNKFNALFAIEISDSGIAQIKKRRLTFLKEIKKFDGYRIPYPEKVFDMAYCSHVIEHVEHPRLLLREIRRVSNYQVFEVPIDYSINVDNLTRHYLSYGHINIFTPSLFKFLLKSEGYEILAERLTHTSREVTRYKWYRNMQLKRSIGREVMLLIKSSIGRFLLKALLGKRRYNEFRFSAYTCLCTGSGEIRIFEKE